MKLKLLIVFAIAGCMLAAACARAELHPATDDAGPGPCSTAPMFTCEAGAPAQDKCSAEPGAFGNAARLPTDAGFTPGCQVYFQGPDCSSEGTCFCKGDDAGSARWSCSP